MISGLLYQRREPIKVPADGLVHPKDNVPAARDYAPFITQSVLHSRIRVLAAYIAKDHWGQSIQLIPILIGAKPFADALVAELRRCGLVDFSVEPVQISSYKGTESTGKYTLHKDIGRIAAPYVLIVDGIVDTGGSAKFLMEHLQKKGVKDIGICALLHKKSRTKHILPLQYIGFEVPDVFIVGFGMDYEQRYRELPFVARMNL
jgi:hypoxanthine phosphoribosyltransferase